VFRQAVTSIASTPEGVAALARVNAGDSVGGVAAMDGLRQGRAAARRARAEIENAIAEAAEAREIAAVALDLRGKGDPAFDTAAVIARYEEVTRLDPGVYNDWYQLFLLYRAAGRNADALAATERMEALAFDDRQRMIAQTFAADILLSQGDRDGAMERYQRSLDIVEQLSAEDPASAALAARLGRVLDFSAPRLTAPGILNAPMGPMRSSRIIERPALPDGTWDRARELSVLLIRLGDVSFSQGDADGAIENYGRAELIRANLASLDPDSLDRERDRAIPAIKIGDVHLSRGDFRSARSAYAYSLAIFEGLFEADPASADRARDVSGLLLRIGDVSLGEGDRDGALERYQRSLDIAERLSAADPTSADLARDVSVASNKVGDALLSQGDAEGARTRYQRGFEINERLSSANPASADQARDLGVSQIKIGDVLLAQADRDGAVARYQAALRIFDRLSAADPASADRARDVFLACLKMGEVNGERRWLERALTILRDLEARGALAPSDRPFIPQIEERLAGAAAAPN
jgi:tetratricopeptide (TPR) repeat protein